MNAQGGVVQSKLHGLERKMNARKSGHRQLRTQKSLIMNSKNSCIHEQTVVRSKFPTPRLLCVQTCLFADVRALTREKKTNYLVCYKKLPKFMSRILFAYLKLSFW